MQNPISEEMRSPRRGLRFHPTDQELLIDYLMPKNLGQPDGEIKEVNVLKSEPWELYSNLGGKSGNEELFLFHPSKDKYRNGQRYDRATAAGYWKPSGRKRPIKSEDTGVPIGEKRTLVFHKGRMPHGERTSWVMHEYHLEPERLGYGHDKNKRLPYVACRIKNTKGKKLTMGHASSSVNQEGDYLNFRDNQHNEFVAAHPVMSAGDLTESLFQPRPPDAMSSDYTTPAHQLLAGAEHGSSSLPGFPRGNDGTGLDFGLPLSPDGDHTLYPNYWYWQESSEAYPSF